MDSDYRFPFCEAPYVVHTVDTESRKEPGPPPALLRSPATWLSLSHTESGTTHAHLCQQPVHQLAPGDHRLVGLQVVVTVPGKKVDSEWQYRGSGAACWFLEPVPVRRSSTDMGKRPAAPPEAEVEAVGCRHSLAQGTSLCSQAS